MNDVQDIARNAAAAEIFQTMASEQKSEVAIAQLRAMSDAQLDMMAAVSGIPEAHRGIFKSIMRGEDSPFMQQLTAFDDQLETGDVILMTGKSIKSKILAQSQKGFYIKAQSSHVALVHADCICIDAMPDFGVSNRLISEVLVDTEDNWRIIRFNKIKEKYQEAIQQRCAFYIEQPYLIFPSKKPAKNFSYCSELARKIYQDCNIEGSHIPKSNAIIKPCDFDRIADQRKDWTEVTNKVRPFIDFCIEYEAIFKVISKLFIDGLKLNRSRYEERRDEIRAIRVAEKKGKVSPDKATEIIKKIHEIERSMHYAFWDFPRLTKLRQ
jgi:Permuted papain-like amidase enzyme, YaeF/YiiX, C92 family